MVKRAGFYIYENENKIEEKFQVKSCCEDIDELQNSVELIYEGENEYHSAKPNYKKFKLQCKLTELDKLLKIYKLVNQDEHYQDTEDVDLKISFEISVNEHDHEYDLDTIKKLKDEVFDVLRSAPEVIKNAANEDK